MFPPLQAPPSTQPPPNLGKNCSLGLEGLLQWRGKARLQNAQLQHPPLCSAKPPCSCQPGVGVWVPGRASRLLEEREPLALPVRPSFPGRWAPAAAPTSRQPARAASAALITPLAPGAGALRPNYDRSFAPAQSMPLTEASERQIRAPRPGKAAAASGGMPPRVARCGRHRDALT